MNSPRDRDVERRVQCFIAELLAHLPYQTVKDAAVNAVAQTRPVMPDEMRPAIGEVAHWLLAHQIGDWLPAGWKPCERPAGAP